VRVDRGLYSEIKRRAREVKKHTGCAEECEYVKSAESEINEYLVRTRKSEWARIIFTFRNQ
jgi:hypothetical protein